MRIYAIAKNSYQWVCFVEESWQRWDYFETLKDAYLNNSAYEQVKCRNLRFRFFINYRLSLSQEKQRDVYEIMEISIVDALNWMASEDKEAFVWQWILDNA